MRGMLMMRWCCGRVRFCRCCIMGWTATTTTTTAAPRITQCANATRTRPFSTTAARARAKTMGQLKARNSTGPSSWKAALLFVVTGGGMMIYFQVEKERLARARIAEMSKGVGRPKVGGPFVLKDLEGRDVTEEELKGKFSLVFPPLSFPTVIRAGC